MSASGKDTICHKLEKDNFKRVITYTTRPPRDNEKDGVDYNFISKEEFDNLIENGNMIEYHTYNTAFGTWYYGSSNLNIDLNKHDYIIILTLEGAREFINYYGANNCIIFYIDCPRKIRESRAESRPNFNKNEWERRLITDKEDFSEKNICEVANFKIRNYNKAISNVVKEIKQDIYIWKHAK